MRRHHFAHAPHLIDPEVLNSLRRVRARGMASGERAAAALADFFELPLFRHAHVPLRRRIWELGDRFTAYDASYVALAEMLGAELVTSDGALARSASSLVAVTHAE